MVRLTNPRQSPTGTGSVKNALNHSEANYLWNPRAMVIFPYPSFTSLSFEWLVSGGWGRRVT